MLRRRRADAAISEVCSQMRNESQAMTRRGPTNTNRQWFVQPRRGRCARARVPDCDVQTEECRACCTQGAREAIPRTRVNGRFGGRGTTTACGRSETVSHRRCTSGLTPSVASGTSIPSSEVHPIGTCGANVGVGLREAGVYRQCRIKEQATSRRIAIRRAAKPHNAHARSRVSLSISELRRRRSFPAHAPSASPSACPDGVNANWTTAGS
jgi:hypothetical protein